ncbi:hypothetical protein [Chryseobacterium pennipullorum]|uniref:Uncharacterized protein n=1 Tax=Chryseobacterium pennipullorum TaxID=2258963 RepID=A0A3D9AZ76_9FLAO|nr:hypothetical protein [Chryseobacterium pennipullorum]REC46307.1 hypothetical protein DRF67_15070 [Chryseobacterium pennipullorum]
MKNESNKEPLQPGNMSNTLIKTLIDNYRQNHLSAINNTLEIKDAHSIWFDLPKLKRFIATIEEETLKQNPDCTEEDLGIRFYYAAYPHAENWSIMDSHPVPVEYAGKHTLVLVPTLKKENETGEKLHYDFNVMNKDDDSIALALNARGKMTELTDITIGENSGTLIPPAPPTGESY